MPNVQFQHTVVYIATFIVQLLSSMQHSHASSLWPFLPFLFCLSNRYLTDASNCCRVSCQVYTVIFEYVMDFVVFVLTYGMNVLLPSSGWLTVQWVKMWLENKESEGYMGQLEEMRPLTVLGGWQINGRCWTNGLHFKNSPFKCQKQGTWRLVHASRKNMNGLLKLHSGWWQVDGCG